MFHYHNLLHHSQQHPSLFTQLDRDGASPSPPPSKTSGKNTHRRLPEEGREQRERERREGEVAGAKVTRRRERAEGEREERERWQPTGREQRERERKSDLTPDLRYIPRNIKDRLSDIDLPSWLGCDQSLANQTPRLVYTKKYPLLEGFLRTSATYISRKL